MNLNHRVPCAIIYRASMDHFEIRLVEPHKIPGNVIIITRDEVIKRQCNGAVQIGPELFEAMRKVLAQVDAQQMRGEEINLGEFAAGPMTTFTSTDSAAYRRMFPFNPDRLKKDAERCAADCEQRTVEVRERVAALEKEFEEKKRQRRCWTIIFIFPWLIAGVIGLFIWTQPCWQQGVSIWFVVDSIRNLISNIWPGRVCLGVKLEHWSMFGASLVLGPTLISQYVGVSNIGVGVGILVLAIGISHVVWKVLLPWRRRKRKVDQ